MIGLTKISLVEIVTMADDRIAGAKRKICDFSAKLSDFGHINHTLCWSGDVFGSAAEIEVWTWIRTTAAHGVSEQAKMSGVVEIETIEYTSISEIARICLFKIAQFDQSNARMSNMTQNLMDDNTRSAWIRAMKFFNEIH